MKYKNQKRANRNTFMIQRKTKKSRKNIILRDKTVQFLRFECVYHSLDHILIGMGEYVEFKTNKHKNETNRIPSPALHKCKSQKTEEAFDFPKFFSTILNDSYLFSLIPVLIIVCYSYYYYYCNAFSSPFCASLTLSRPSKITNNNDNDAIFFAWKKIVKLFKKS